MDNKSPKLVCDFPKAISCVMCESDSRGDVELRSYSMPYFGLIQMSGFEAWPKYGAL